LGIPEPKPKALLVATTDRELSARIETLTGQSVVIVRDLVLEEISADLPVNEKTAVTCSPVDADKWDLETVAKTRGWIEVGCGIFCVRAQIADRQTSVQVLAIHIQRGNVGASAPAFFRRSAR
jgi:hypothetical protein